jgi:PAS domain S-box-containing protein
MSLPSAGPANPDAARAGIKEVSLDDSPRFAWRAWAIAGTYALFAGLWILFSDIALSAIVRDPEQFIEWSVYKGFAFVVATSLLLLLLIRRGFAAVESAYRSARTTAAIVSGQNTVLGMIASSAPLADSLRALLEFIERQSPDMRCSVLLLDADGMHLRHGAAPSLPRAYMQAIDGAPIGANAGSCGTAAFLREQVIVTDIATDPRWTDYRDLALPHGLRACWSTPIFDAQQRVLGTFAMYFDNVRSPTETHRSLIRVATHLAAVAIERDRAAQALTESESRFHAFMDASPAIAWMTDDQGRHLYMNVRWDEAFGLNRDEWIGKTAEDLVSPEAAARIRESDHALLAQNVPLEIPEEDVVLQGEHHVWRLFKFPFRSTGDQRFIGGIALDITKRKEAEAALREVEERLQVVVENLREGLIVADPDGNFLHWNPAALRILGFDDAEEGRRQQQEFYRYFEIATLEDAPLAADEWPLARVRRGDTLENYEVRVRRRDSNWERLLSYSGALVEYADGHRLAFLTLSDITERKRAELLLREANEQLEQKVEARTSELRTALVRAEAADRLKSAFLATMSHELRTPLNSIIGFTGIVLQELAGPLTSEQSKQLGMVRGSARHLLALINDVLDLSKIEAGQLEIRNEPFELPEAIERVVASVRPMAEKKGLELRVETDPALHVMVSDQRRVEQILLNLLNNAIKFTNTGTVTLDVDASGSSVRLRVTDTGIGIKAADLDQLFQPFRQIDTGLSRQHEGTGLGLSICRRLCELLGGSIDATSTWTQGSVFTVVLPLFRRA